MCQKRGEYGGNVTRWLQGFANVLQIVAIIILWRDVVVQTILCHRLCVTRRGAREAIARRDERHYTIHFISTIFFRRLHVRDGYDERECALIVAFSEDVLVCQFDGALRASGILRIFHFNYALFVERRRFYRYRSGCDIGFVLGCALFVAAIYGDNRRPHRVPHGDDIGVFAVDVWLWHAGRMDDESIGLPVFMRSRVWRGVYQTIDYGDGGEDDECIEPRPRVFALLLDRQYWRIFGQDVYPVYSPRNWAPLRELFLGGGLRRRTHHCDIVLSSRERRNRAQIVWRTVSEPW